MDREFEHIKVDISNVDFFPAVIDFDFEKMRPRGGSSKIDFFSYGKLSLELDKVNVMSNLFIKKRDMLFEKGVFLVDFSKLNEKSKDISEMIRNINEKIVYIELSNTYSVEPLVELLQDYDIKYLVF